MEPGIWESLINQISMMRHSSSFGTYNVPMDNPINCLFYMSKTEMYSSARCSSFIVDNGTMALSKLLVSGYKPQHLLVIYIITTTIVWISTHNMICEKIYSETNGNIFSCPS
jgi:hypothetical protein